MWPTYFWLPFSTITCFAEVFSCHHFYKQPRFRILVVTSVIIKWSVGCATSINAWRKEFHCIHLTKIGNIHIASIFTDVCTCAYAGRVGANGLGFSFLRLTFSERLLQLAFTFSLLITYQLRQSQLLLQKTSKKQYITLHHNYLLSVVITFYVFICLQLKCLKSEVAKWYGLWQS